MKKSPIYLILSIIVISLVSYTQNGNKLEPLILSDSFFIIGIVSLILACLSRVVSWSIHKRYALDKIKANKMDIDEAKAKLKAISNYLAVFGLVHMIISFILVKI